MIKDWIQIKTNLKPLSAADGEEGEGTYVAEDDDDEGGGERGQSSIIVLTSVKLTITILKEKQL